MDNEKIIIVDNEETNYLITRDGKIYNRTTKRELKGSYKSQDYQTVQLVINKKPRTFLVHRLVAQAFCPNPNNYNIVDHIDRNKTNNNADNLRWVTNSENSRNINAKKEVKRKIKFKGKLDNSWKPISFAKQYYINQDGQVVNSDTNYYLLGTLRCGYRRYLINGKSHLAHLLVWEAFNGTEIPKGMVIDYIDGNKENNNINNLRMVTQSENMQNAYKNGAGHIVAVQQIDDFGKVVAEYKTIQEAADAMNVTHPAIRSAIQRKGKCNSYYWKKKE